MRILILYPFLVKAGSLGGVARVTRLLPYLDERGHDVWLACFATETELASEMPTQEVRSHCREMVVLPTEPRSVATKALSLIFDPHPSCVAHYNSRAMRAELDRMLRAHDIDVLHIEFTYMGDYVTEASGTGCATVLVDEELNFHASQRLFRTSPLSKRGLRALWESIRFKRHELDVVTKFDRVLAITDGERDVLLEHRPDLDVGVYPNTVDTQFFAPVDQTPEPDTIAFVGNFEHYPNADGVKWFVREVLPRIRAAVPGTRLDLIGANVTPAIRDLHDGTSVRVLGFVDDIRPHLARASVFVCPLINGGGMRGKALEAMAMGLPVVTTPIGIEGIAANDRHVLVASDPNLFADSILRLFADDELRRTLGSSARTLVRDHYDDSVVFSNLEQEYERLAALARSRREPSASTMLSSDINEVSEA